MEDGTARREYAYDRRGNLTGETEGGTLLHGYAYGAMNRLTRAWNGQGKEASYRYNGLGQRIGREVREGDRTLTERYLLDMTRPYHNLLGIEKEGHAQTFYYDGNVAAMEEKGSGLHYYLQDELGSPLRVSGYGKRAGAGEGSGTGTGAGSPAAPGYLTYGYDEFGNDLYRELEESGIPSPYDRQGEEQPFGYTGYRYDDISGTYFAQAREYQPRSGRFTAEDVVKGNGAVPQTLNRYGYCWGNPVGLVDNDGKNPIAQQGANEIIWDYFLNQLNNTVNAKKAKWDKYANSIKESWNDFVNNIQTDLDNVLDGAKNFIGAKVEEIHNTLAPINGTVTEKISVNANALLGVYVDIGISQDWKGNVAVQWSYAVPSVNDTASVGILDVGIGVGWAFTNSEDINGLLGQSSTIGASGGYLGYATVDLISFDDMSDMNSDLNGVQVGVGFGAGLDIHLAETYTHEIIRFNKYDLLFKILGWGRECIQ